jgi:hypothetical protein
MAPADSGEARLLTVPSRSHVCRDAPTKLQKRKAVPLDRSEMSELSS